jgi:hypothetical protein
MAAVAQPVATRRQRRPLFEAGKLRCPQDKQLHHIEDYISFDRNVEFAPELNVVLKCRCGHIFSPGITDEEMKALVTANA